MILQLLIFLLQFILMQAAKMHWYAPFFSSGGYCSEAQDFAKSLANSSVPFQIFQHGDSFNQYYLHNILSYDSLSLLKQYSRTSVESNFTIAVCHSEPGAWSAPNAAYNTLNPCPPSDNFAKNEFTHSFVKGNIADYKIGRTMFETDRLPSGWSKRLNYMNEIWVPTAFSYNIFVENGVAKDKLRIVPVPLDTKLYAPLPRMPHAHTVFLFVGKVEARKGLDVLLYSYITEFWGQGDVELRLLLSTYHSSEDQMFQTLLHNVVNALESIHDDVCLRVYAESSMNTYKDQLNRVLSCFSPVISIFSNVKEYEMPMLYATVDALVIPSFGEGWGRPHVEALACGTPVIATDWSGVTAYLTEENGYPVALGDYRYLQYLSDNDDFNIFNICITNPAYWSRSYFFTVDICYYDELLPSTEWKGHYRANPASLSTRWRMREVYLFPNKAREKGSMGVQTVSKFSISNVSKLLEAEVVRIENIYRLI